jgi:hypothetical protein
MPAPTGDISRFSVRFYRMATTFSGKYTLSTEFWFYSMRGLVSMAGWGRSSFGLGQQAQVSLRALAVHVLSIPAKR